MTNPDASIVYGTILTTSKSPNSNFFSSGNSEFKLDCANTLGTITPITQTTRTERSRYLIV
ncbi:MAG TPA: hypothetical protein EYN25_00140 [Candidatus Nitrosopelagicus sp.]|nr:hypothetical protein [Candidatus Nitrosopelagicus sp.]